jgi:hypothetical protein
MNETATAFLGTTATAAIGYPGTYGNGIATPLSGNINAMGGTSGLSLSGNSTIIYTNNLNK